MRNLTAKLIFSISLFSVIFVCFFVLLLVSLNWLGSGGELSAKIQEVIDNSRAGGDWGIMAADIKTGRTVYKLNADKLFPAASVRKLFTMAAALDTFGANYRFKTSVYRQGRIFMGRLKGDLILVLSPVPFSGIDELARQVSMSGIRRISGKVIVDGRLFKSNKIDYRALFIKALKNQGIRVETRHAASLKRPAYRLPAGKAGTGRHAEPLLPPRGAYMKMKQIAVVLSPPFAETLKSALKPGQDDWAGTFLLLIALQNGRETARDGLDIEMSFLNRLGVNLKDISINAGEGRAEDSLSSPGAAVVFLRAMAKRPDFIVYRDALPVRGHAFAAEFSNGMAGYITTLSGKQTAFAAYAGNAGPNNINDAAASSEKAAKIAEIIYKTQ